MKNKKFKSENPPNDYKSDTSYESENKINASIDHNSGSSDKKSEEPEVIIIEEKVEQDNLASSSTTNEKEKIQDLNNPFDQETAEEQSNLADAVQQETKNHDIQSNDDGQKTFIESDIKSNPPEKSELEVTEEPEIFIVDEKIGQENVARSLTTNEIIKVRETKDPFNQETIDDQDDLVNESPIYNKQKKWRGGKISLIATGLLVCLLVIYEIFILISDYFIQSFGIGLIALTLVSIIVVSFVVFIFREWRLLIKTRQFNQIKDDVKLARDTDDINIARGAVRKLLKLYENRPNLMANRKKIEEHLDQILDGKDLIEFTEENLLNLLDKQARELILATSLRVALGTAISPKAFIDIFIIVGENIRLIRKLAELYGISPGKIGMYRLLKEVAIASTVAGAIETGGTFLTEILGVGVLTKLTRKAGEGVANGTLTIRIGLAVVDICRPCPIVITDNFQLKNFVKSLFSSFKKKVPEDSTDTKN